MFGFAENFLETLWTWVLPSIIKILLILVIAFGIMHLTNLATNNFIRRFKQLKRAETLKQIICSSTRVVVIVITVMMILHELGIDIRPIIASAGLLSLAISLGAQHLVKDVVNGFFILLENQFSVDDIIKISDITGIVIAMNLRTTTLKDSNGSIHIIPNGQISQVSVLSQAK